LNPWLAARNILAVRLDNAGDVVMLGPALCAVKACSPQARITLLATPAGTAAAQLLPWVDAVITWRPIWQDLGHLPDAPERELELVQLLAARRFDAALIFSSFSQTPHVPGYVCYLAGIPLRAGESKEFGGRCLTSELRGAADSLHQVERNLRLVEALGFVAQDRRLAISIDGTAHHEAQQAIVSAGIDATRPFVLVHPGASAQARRYPPERMGAVVALLAARGHQVLLTGSERERALVAEFRIQDAGFRIQKDEEHRIIPVAAQQAAQGSEAQAQETRDKRHETEDTRQKRISAPSAPSAVQTTTAGGVISSLLGETSITVYAALIERAAVVVCGNTLPLHLADALHTPVVALYAGTDLEEQWRPRFTASRLLRQPTPCYPCYLFRCPFAVDCLAIPAERVVQAVEELVEEANHAHAT
jgi:ADP-heptose:LPS heptosyltransferase